MINYTKLMSHNPHVLGTIFNTLGQKIVLVEHPLQGDLSPVLAVCHEMQLAGDTGFFDTVDMEEGTEYQPSFQDGKLYIGDFEA